MSALVPLRVPRREKSTGHRVATLFLSVTKRCNLTCTYCSADAGPDREESLDVGLAIARVREWVAGARSSELHLIFSGGEATLWGWDSLDRVCETATEEAAGRSKALKLDIQTNGTNVTDRFVAWCKRWNVEPSLSLDGPPALSDAHRGRGDRVVRGMRALATAGIPFAVVTCVTKEVAANIDDVLEFYRAHGARKVRLNTVGAAPPGRGVPDDGLSADELFAVKRAIYLHRERFGDAAVDELNVARQVAWFDGAMRGEDVVHGHCSRLRCGAGEEVAAVNPDGRISMCIEKSMTDGLPNASSFDELPSVTAAYWRGFEGWSECATCYARPICDHGCPAYHRLDHSLFASECVATRRFFAFLLSERT